MSVVSAAEKATPTPSKKATGMSTTEAAIAKLRKMPPINLNNARYLKLLWVSALKMLAERKNRNIPNSDYRVENLLAEAENLAVEDLQLYFLSIPNIVRDMVASKYPSSQIPSIRVIMSCLIQNGGGGGGEFSPPPTYTALFFTEKKNTQVTKQLVQYFLSVLSMLQTSRFLITENIFINPAPFSPSSISELREIGMGCFTQLFEDSSILSSPLDSHFSPKYRVFTDSETKAFMLANPSYRGKNFQLISHNDAQLKYLGVRRGRIVEIVRKEILPFNIQSNPVTHAWIV